MNGGFEAARGQRNWLERLGEKIPGFRGFQDRELRRDVDRLQREHLSREASRIKAEVRDAARAATDAGRIGLLDRFDRLDRRLDGLSQAIRFADYGQTGLFDAVKIGDAELERLYRFDLSLVEGLEGLAAAVRAMPPPGDPRSEAALAAALDRVDELARKWAERDTLVGDVVRTAS